MNPKRTRIQSHLKTQQHRHNVILILASHKHPSQILYTWAKCLDEATQVMRSMNKNLMNVSFITRGPIVVSSSNRCTPRLTLFRSFRISTEPCVLPTIKWSTPVYCGLGYSRVGIEFVIAHRRLLRSFFVRSAIFADVIIIHSFILHKTSNRTAKTFAHAVGH